MNYKNFFILATVFGTSGCVTLTNDKEDSTKVKITEMSETQFKFVEFTELDGLTEYDHNGAPQKAEWVVCKGANTKVSVIAMHSDRAGYEKTKFCAGWVAQSFLAQGFNVVTVNRPGYGGSSGEPDFAGAQSMQAVIAAVADATAKSKVAAPTGIWGYSTGATAAALASRKLKGMKFIILGGGVYDLDDTLKKTQDSYLKADIETIQRTGGDKAIEDRSIAYDASGLPKNVLIYHGKNDVAVPQAQAKSFSDSLESSGECKVTFQVIDGVSHEIPWTHHRKILEVLASSMSGV